MAEIGYAHTLEWSTDGGTTYNMLGGITNISPPNMSRDAQDVTNFNSPGMTREFIFGLIDPGEIKVDVIWIPGDASDTGIDALISVDPINWKLTLNLSGAIVKTVTFVGGVTDKTPTAALGEKLTASITIKISGQVTMA